MSLKAIEMQVALPRTFEAGKTTQQHQQQGQMMQEFIGAQLEKELEKKRKAVVEQEATAKANNEKKEGQHSQEDRQQSKQDKEKQKKSHHPYKGKQIDVRG